MANPAVRQFAGDIRFWQAASGGAYLPVIPEPADPQGNQPVEVTSLTFGYEAGDEISVVSKRRDARYNQPIHQETLPGTTTVTTTLLEIPPLILARMLYGEGSDATVSAGQVTEQVIPLPNAAVPLVLPHRMLLSSPAPVIENEDGDKTYVAGTDYSIDYRQGLLVIPAGSAIVTDGETALTVSYSYDDHVSLKIAGGATPTAQFRITGDMEDRISGENGLLVIPQANLTTDGDVDWLSDEPIQVTVTGPVIVAPGESAPYTFQTYR